MARSAPSEEDATWRERFAAPETPELANDLTRTVNPGCDMEEESLADCVVVHDPLIEVAWLPFPVEGRAEDIERDTGVSDCDLGIVHGFQSFVSYRRGIRSRPPRQPFRVLANRTRSASPIPMRMIAKVGPMAGTSPALTAVMTM